MSSSPGMHEIKSANNYRIEDFNKAKDLAQSAAKSGAYLYPIKVSWSWIDLLTEHPLTLHRVSSTSSAIGHYGNPSSPSSPQR